MHAVRVVGADHVALGLDMEEFTAAVLPPELRDIRDLPKLTTLALARGVTEDDLATVLGGSTFRFLEATLPIE